MPAQVINAQKIFITNGGVKGSFADVYSGGPNRPYDEFYAAMKNWGKYALVSSLAGADVVAEVTYNMADGTEDLS